MTLDEFLNYFIQTDYYKRILSLFFQFLLTLIAIILIAILLNCIQNLRRRRKHTFLSVKTKNGVKMFNDKNSNFNLETASDKADKSKEVIVNDLYNLGYCNNYSNYMEITGLRHKTTIEIKTFKTAVVALNGRDEKIENHTSKIEHVIMNGHVKEIDNHISIDHNEHNLENGISKLIYDHGHLIEDDHDHHDHCKPCYHALSKPADQKGLRYPLSAEYNIVELSVRQQVLESYEVIDRSRDHVDHHVVHHDHVDHLDHHDHHDHPTTQSISLTGSSIDEHHDHVEESITWRTKDQSTVRHERPSSSRRSSVLDVLRVHDVAEVLTKLDSLESITDVVRLAGLEYGRLIFGIDYTASNKQQGRTSFGGQSLHHIQRGILNPYQQVISIMGKTLAPLTNGGCIPAYGFGDIKTSDTSIFSLKEDGHCDSFDEVLQTYNEITPRIILSGPTNFAPLIYQAIEICKELKKYHILVIVADGQVTNEPDTRRAIVQACAYPLSIIVVGVGDGPWDMMKIFDEKLPRRPWDNFHFVEFYKITHNAKNPELAFAVQALLEIPDQYKEIKALGLFN